LASHKVPFAKVENKLVERRAVGSWIIRPLGFCGSLQAVFEMGDDERYFSLGAAKGNHRHDAGVEQTDLPRASLL
jgi:hypothetical protein